MADAIGIQHAELLGKVEIFAGLDRLALAQLAAHVEAIALPAGTTLFQQGDRADCLYVVARGAVGVYTEGTGAAGETKLGSLTIGDSVGEMALLTGEPRSATVRAEDAAEVLRLDRDNFLDVVQRQPAVAAAVTTILSRRLRAADQARLQGDVAIGQTLDDVLGELTDDRRTQVMQAGLLSTHSAETVRAFFGDDADDVALCLGRLGLRNGRLPSPAARLLRERFEREVGADAVERFGAEAGARLADAGCWEEALELLVRQPDRAAFVDALGRALRAVPPIESVQASRWIERLTEDELAQDPELALAAATLLEERGNGQIAIRALERALGAALLAGNTGAAQRLTATIASSSTTEAALQETPPRRSPFSRRPAQRRRVRASIAIGVAVAFAVAATAPGAGHPQLVFVLLLGAALALWQSDLFPEFAVTLLLLGSWTLWGIAQPEQAVAGFASMDWIFVVAVLAIAVAVARSGLLFRVGLLLVRRTPAGLAWQAGAMLLTGLLLSPLLPDPRGRAALTGPLALAVAQASRLKDREPAAAVLGLAAWIGSGPLMFLFMNAAPVCLLAWGLLPADRRSQIDWLSWLVAALPLGALVSLGAMGALFVLLRPTIDSAPSRERLNLQLAVLGPPTTRELAMVAVLVLTVLGWFVAPALHVHVGVVAILGLFAAVALGSFDQGSLREMDWGYLIYYGGALSIGHMVHTLGIGGGATGGTGGEGPLLDSAPLAFVGPVGFLLLVAAAGMLVRLVIEPSQAILALSLVFIPMSTAVSVNPFLVAVVLLATNSMWFSDKQTAAYEVAYRATDGRLYSHGQATRVAFGYAAVTLVAIVLCVPYWRLLGML